MRRKLSNYLLGLVGLALLFATAFPAYIANAAFRCGLISSPAVGGYQVQLGDEWTPVLAVTGDRKEWLYFSNSSKTSVLFWRHRFLQPWSPEELWISNVSPEGAASSRLSPHFFDKIATPVGPALSLKPEHYLAVFGITDEKTRALYFPQYHLLFRVLDLGVLEKLRRIEQVSPTP